MPTRALALRGRQSSTRQRERLRRPRHPPGRSCAASGGRTQNAPTIAVVNHEKSAIIFAKHLTHSGLRPLWSVCRARGSMARDLERDAAPTRQDRPRPGRLRRARRRGCSEARRSDRGLSPRRRLSEAACRWRRGRTSRPRCVNSHWLWAPAMELLHTPSYRTQDHHIVRCVCSITSTLWHNAPKILPCAFANGVVGPGPAWQKRCLAKAQTGQEGPNSLRFAKT